MIGADRSLMTAVVPSGVVSLWAVADAPMALLIAEEDPQLQRHRDPLDWAAFALLGIL